MHQVRVKVKLQMTAFLRNYSMYLINSLNTQTEIVLEGFNAKVQREEKQRGIQIA
jgi:hypothetical protein